LRVLDCKNSGCREQTKEAPLMVDHLCPECAEHFTRVSKLLDRLGIDYVLDGRLVRGLDYYTKTAFEILSGELGAQDALGGGGRYDDLIEMLGGDPTPAVGFAAGVERLLLVLSKQGISQVPDEPLELFVVALGERAKEVTMELLSELRQRLVRCDADFLGRSLRAQMRAANRLRARYVLIIGENELNKNKLVLKDMGKSQQEEIDLDETIDRVCDRLVQRSPSTGEKGCEQEKNAREV
jgi:histidyl-tRNA synthetase